LGVPARFVGAPLCAFSNTIQARPLLGFPTRIAQEVEELNGLEEAFRGRRQRLNRKSLHRRVKDKVARSPKSAWGAFGSDLDGSAPR
jgi:hypothetical protein